MWNSAYASGEVIGLSPSPTSARWNDPYSPGFIIQPR